MKALVIVANGLHLGYLGCYGNNWIQTPAFDRLASEGIAFDQHYANDPTPAGACQAWRTACYRLPTPESEVPPPKPVAELMPLLRKRGVTTSSVVDGNQPFPRDLTTLWEHVRTVQPNGGEDTALERTLEAVQEALGQLAEVENWLLWVELTTLLPPWEVPSEYVEPYFQSQQEEEEEEADDAEGPLAPLLAPQPGFVDPADETTFRRLQRSYAGVVTYLDAGLELLFEALQERGLTEEVLALVTTDRGQALGEHGVVGDLRPWLHDEWIHLPLLVRLPGAAEAGRRVSALTQPVDLLPTLLDYFGVPVPAVHGQSLLPLLRGEAEGLRAYACAGARIGEAVEWALRTPEWSFLLPLQPASGDPPRGAQLYVKPDDRWEVNNVLQHNLELAEHLERTLRGFVKATTRPGILLPPPLPNADTRSPDFTNT